MYFVCVERSLYWVGWISVIIYALWQFALACQSKDHVYRLNLQDFRDGFLSKSQYDATDFEWQSLKKLYINYWYIVFIHFALSNMFTVCNQPNFKLTSWILITLYATYTVFSISALVVVIINVVMLILLALIGKNFLSYVLCFGVVLASQSTEIANRIFNANDPRMTNEFDFEEKRFLFTYCICFLNARGLSSSIDNFSTQKQKKEIQSGKDSFFDKLITIAAYLLYLPGFFAGPIYLYNDFEQATRIVRAEPTKQVFLGSSYFQSMTKLFVLMANILYYEWALHFLYSSAVSTDNVLISGYGSWEISGFVVSLCLLFYCKYTCIFGIFKVLTAFDGLSSIAPPMPQCVATMHLNSQLWSKFDAGIYIWLRRYIYNPIVNESDRSTTRRFLGSLVCFLCIAVWHLPLTPTLIIWITLNIISALIEIWAKALNRTEFWVKFRNYLSRSAYLRTLALLGLPLYMLAIVSQVFFLSSNEHVANEFVKQILNNKNNYTFYLLAVLYLGANVSLDYNKVVKSSVSFCQSHRISSCGKQKTSETTTKQQTVSKPTSKKDK